MRRQCHSKVAICFARAMICTAGAQHCEVTHWQRIVIAARAPHRNAQHWRGTDLRRRALYWRWNAVLGIAAALQRSVTRGSARHRHGMVERGIAQALHIYAMFGKGTDSHAKAKICTAIRCIGAAKRCGGGAMIGCATQWQCYDPHSSGKARFGTTGEGKAKPSDAVEMQGRATHG